MAGLSDDAYLFNELQLLWLRCLPRHYFVWRTDVEVIGVLVNASKSNDEERSYQTEALWSLDK